MEYATHICGGTILGGGSGEQAHIYCDRCGAFTRDPDDIEDGQLPSGTDKGSNEQAWNAAEESSPDHPLMGRRVEAGEGADHDTGRVERIDSTDMAYVAWDSGVKTPAAIADLRLA